MRLEFHPAAAAELKQAAVWYRDRSPVAARSLLVELESALARILASPSRFPPYVAGSRRCFLPTFPFGVIYLSNDECVLVLAIAHHRRRPGFWTERVPKIP